MSKLREDILFTLTGDSYGEELYVDDKAKHLADNLETKIKTLMLELVEESVHDAFSGSQAIETLKEKVNNL